MSKKKRKDRNGGNNTGSGGNASGDKSRRVLKPNGYLLLARNEAAAALLRAAKKEIEINGVPEPKRPDTSITALKQFAYYTGVFWKSVFERMKSHTNVDIRNQTTSPERLSERIDASFRGGAVSLGRWIVMLVSEIVVIILLVLETLFVWLRKLIVFCAKGIAKAYRYLSEVIHRSWTSFSIWFKGFREDVAKKNEEIRQDREVARARKLEESEFRRERKAEEAAFQKAKKREEEAIRDAKRREEEAAKETKRIESELAMIALRRKEEEERVLHETQRKEEAMAALAEARKEEEAERLRLEEKRRIEEESRKKAEQEEAEAVKRLEKMQAEEAERIRKEQERIAEEEAKKKAEEERIRREEEEKAEAERKRQEEIRLAEEARKKAEEERIRREEEEKAEAERKRQEEIRLAEEARKKAEEERIRKEKEEKEHEERIAREAREAALKKEQKEIEEVKAETEELLKKQVEKEEADHKFEQEHLSAEEAYLEERRRKAAPAKPKQSEPQTKKTAYAASAAHTAVKTLPVRLPTISVPENLDAKELITEARDNTNGVIYRVVKSLELDKVTENVQSALLAGLAKYGVIALGVTLFSFIGVMRNQAETAPGGSSFALLFFGITVIGILLAAGFSYLCGTLVSFGAADADRFLFVRKNSRYVPISTVAYLFSALILAFNRSKFVAVIIAVLLLSVIGHLWVMYRESDKTKGYLTAIYLLCLIIAAGIIVLLFLLFSETIHGIWNALA